MDEADAERTGERVLGKPSVGSDISIYIQCSTIMQELESV